MERLIGFGAGPGRPTKNRASLAHAFLAKAVFDLSTTRALIERLQEDEKMRRLCGWTSVRAIPSEATFSRAFAEFAETPRQASIPLAMMTSKRVRSLYHLMDSAYDAREIRDHILSLGHVAIIDTNPRRSAGRKQEKAREANARRSIGYTRPEIRRYAERTTVERVNGRLKDDFGARHLRACGAMPRPCAT